MHKLTILALDGFVIMDLGIPADIFAMAQIYCGRQLYETEICGWERSVETYLFDIKTRYGLERLELADTIIVPGITDTSWTVSENVKKALRQAAARGARIASICTGAFVLAEAGLLDGLRATTHWQFVDEMAARYPKIKVEPDVLFVDNGRILTSAGITSGVDLCLHLIRKDYGAVMASIAAKHIVMPLERDGGQMQLIKHEMPESGDNLNNLLFWLMENLQRNLSVEDIARRAGMSVRNFNRRFRDQTGTTPLQWILTARVRRSQQLLEATDLSIEDIATASGFESAANFRDRFKRVVGVSPSSWRNTYRV